METAPLHESLVAVHAGAPDKPARGAPCNGCGVCCAAETCPAARLALRQFRGPCRALSWDGEKRRYFCGLVCAPRKWLPWLPGALEPAAARFFARLVAAGTACDSDAELLP